MPIRASARPMAAFSDFYGYGSHGPTPSGNARGIVPAHHHGHRNGQKSGHILHLRFVCCRPGGRQGNTEPVVPRWQHLVAFMKALVMLHLMMPHVPRQRLRAAIKMAYNGGAFVRRHRLFCLT